MIENRMVQPFADDDAIGMETCEIHALTHPDDQMCHACLTDKLQAERSKEIAKKVADDLVAALRDIGGA